METVNKRNSPPLGILVLLSFTLPGAGQLANGDKVKGCLFIAVSLLLLLVFFARLADVFPRVYADLLAGVVPVATEEFMSNMKTLGLILLAGLFVSVTAAVDAVIVGKRRS